MSNLEHVIKEAIFSFHLDGAMSEETIKNLKPIKESLLKDLPKSEDIKAVKIELKNDQLSSSGNESKLVGFILTHMKTEKDIDWIVRVEQNHISVNCLDYTGWQTVWPKAQSYLITIMNEVISKHRIIAINLQYVNRITSESAGYSLTDTLKYPSPYLTDNIKKAGELWHIYQGWLENDAIIKCKCLNNLNMSTIVENSRHVTTISLLRQARDFQCETKKTLDELSIIMDRMHLEIKKILLDVFAPKLASEIGLAAPANQMRRE